MQQKSFNMDLWEENIELKNWGSTSKKINSRILLSPVASNDIQEYTKSYVNIYNIIYSFSP